MDGWYLYGSNGANADETTPEDYSAALNRLDAADDFSDLTEGSS